MPKFSIKATKTITENREIEIEFPLFLKYDGTWNSDNYEIYETFTRVNEDLSAIEISKSKFYNSPAEYSIKEFKARGINDFSTHLMGNSSDYTYGNDPLEFNTLFNEIKKVMGL